MGLSDFFSLGPFMFDGIGRVNKEEDRAVYALPL
jgi:hypothetical protein